MNGAPPSCRRASTTGWRPASIAMQGSLTNCGRHQFSVVADQQLREDMALLVFVVFASRPTEVVEDVGGELACLRVRPARCKPGDQRRKLAQREPVCRWQTSRTQYRRA